MRRLRNVKIVATLGIAVVCGVAVGLAWGLALGVKAVVLVFCNLLAAFFNGIIAFLPHLAVMWVTIVGQVLVCLVGVAFTLWISGQILTTITVRFDQLAREHAAALEELKKRTPPLVLTAGLIGQIALIVPGVVFDDKFMILSVTGILTLTFWVANEFLVQDSRSAFWFGVVLWSVGVLALPFLIVVNAGGIQAFIDQLNKHWVLGVSCLLLTLIAVAMPFLSQAVNKVSAPL